LRAGAFFDRLNSSGTTPSAVLIRQSGLPGGDKAMGFSHEKSAHHFDLISNGGIIEPFGCSD
jgi:hypothetical protein